jgi:hypothetical protein
VYFHEFFGTIPLEEKYEKNGAGKDVTCICLNTEVNMRKTRERPENPVPESDDTLIFSPHQYMDTRALACMLSVVD